MATFTIEIQELVPNYLHVTVEADNLDAAIKQAKEEAALDPNWCLDWENVRPEKVTGAWEGESAYCGNDLLAK